MFNYNIFIELADKLNFDQRQGFYGILYSIGEGCNDKDLMETTEILIESTLVEERILKQESLLEKYAKYSA